MVKNVESSYELILSPTDSAAIRLFKCPLLCFALRSWFNMNDWIRCGVSATDVGEGVSHSSHLYEKKSFIFS